MSTREIFFKKRGKLCLGFKSRGKKEEVDFIIIFIRNELYSWFRFSAVIIIFIRPVLIVAQHQQWIDDIHFKSSSSCLLCVYLFTYNFDCVNVVGRPATLNLFQLDCIFRPYLYLISPLCVLYRLKIRAHLLHQRWKTVRAAAGPPNVHSYIAALVLREYIYLTCTSSWQTFHRPFHRSFVALSLLHLSSPAPFRAAASFGCSSRHHIDSLLYVCILLLSLYFSTAAVSSGFCPFSLSLL